MHRWAVTADEYRAELTRGIFSNGFSSPFIRQRIIEKDELSLMQAVELADNLNRAQKQAAIMDQEMIMTVGESDPSPYVPFEPDCSLSPFNKRKVKYVISMVDSCTQIVVLALPRCCMP